MPDEKLNKLKELMKIAGEGLTRSEFTQSFKNVVDLVTKVQKNLIEKIDAKLSQSSQQITNALTTLEPFKKEFQKAIDDAKSANETTFEAVRKRAIESIDGLFNRMRLNEKLNAALKDFESKSNALEDKILQVPQAEEIVKAVVALIPPEVEETAIETRDKLESIKDEKDKLNISAISELRKELDELKKKLGSQATRSGGVSALGVRQAFKYIAHTEQPSGLINSSNTIYTVKNEIFWIAGFTLNGEQIAQLPNFTVSGRTITFASALPSAYSGKDFECKYIG